MLARESRHSTESRRAEGKFNGKNECKQKAPCPYPALQDAGEASDTPCHGAAASSTPMQYSYQEYSYPCCTLIKVCGLITPVILNYIPAGSQFSYFYLFEVVRQAAIDVSMNSVKAPIMLSTKNILYPSLLQII